MRDEAMAKRLSEELAGSGASSHAAQTAGGETPAGFEPSDACAHAHGVVDTRGSVGPHGYTDEAARLRQEEADEAFARKLMEDGTPEKAPAPSEGGGGVGEREEDVGRLDGDARAHEDEEDEEEEEEEEVVVVAEQGVGGDVAEVESGAGNGGVHSEEEGEGWDCPTCTFHNSQFTTSMECEMCGTAMHGEGAASPTKRGDAGAGVSVESGPAGASDMGLGPTSPRGETGAHTSISLPPPPGKGQEGLTSPELWERRGSRKSFR